MKLKITSSTALLAFAAASAHAQSSVTLYGVLDTGLIWQSTNVATFVPNAAQNRNLGSRVGLNEGGSMFGLTGSEDLGGGYRANFKLQGSFSLTNGRSGLPDAPGAASMFTQVSTVGLRHTF